MKLPHQIKVIIFLLLGFSVFASAGETIIISGGPLDPDITGADIYLEKPTAGKLVDTPACLQAEKYVSAVNEGDYTSVAGLFADDAVVLEPVREIYRGKEEITEFYQQRIKDKVSDIIAVHYAGNRDDCIIALASLITYRGEKRYALVSVDHFTLDEDGKFSRMVAYARPPRVE